MRLSITSSQRSGSTFSCTPPFIIVTAMEGRPVVGKDDIIFGRLRSGELLILQKICAQMNVSSAPVREALNMLSKEGLVDLPPPTSEPP